MASLDDARHSGRAEAVTRKPGDTGVKGRLGWPLAALIILGSSVALWLVIGAIISIAGGL